MLATSTGSPASRNCKNLIPLTTRPALTSRQGMIRFASIGGESSRSPWSSQELVLMGNFWSARERRCDGLADFVFERGITAAFSGAASCEHRCAPMSLKSKVKKQAWGLQLGHQVLKLKAR